MASPVTAPLYARIMGDTWLQIAEPIRDLHATGATTRGCLRVEHGRHRLARFLAGMLRLPVSCAAADAQLTVTTRDGGERWQRAFSGRRFETFQYQSNEAELAERYGPLEFRFRLQAAEGSLRYIQREAAVRIGIGRMRLPRRLAPHVTAREDAAGPGHVHVIVTVTLPGIGLLMAYDGIVDITEARS
jgi:hypothetical protein